MKLQNKVAIVTGASKGIGANIAEKLAAEGAAVVVNYASSQAGAQAVVDKILAAGGRAVAVRADVSEPTEQLALFEAAEKAFGKVDVLVNNAGIYEVAPLEQVTADHFHRQFNLNVLAPLLLSQLAAARMQAGSSIINVSSVVSTLSPANTVVYNATKAALDALTRTLAKELGARGIRVNSINPGLVETEGLHASPLIGAREALAAITPLGRIGKPEDIAPGVVFLASDDSGWMTGDNLYIAGGLR
ncbi:glucose 1-dehydrogenase [bacterium]|nr:glucose 1-dehydrogenase [bacterium]